MALDNSLTLTVPADNAVNKSVKSAISLPHHPCVEVHKEDSQLVQLSGSE